MAGEIIFIGAGVLFFGAAAISEWNSSRCSSNEAWFHDWVRNNDIPEQQHDYDNGRYTVTSATFACRYCKEIRQLTIHDTKPNNVDYSYD